MGGDPVRTRATHVCVAATQLRAHARVVGVLKKPAVLCRQNDSICQYMCALALNDGPRKSPPGVLLCFFLLDRMLTIVRAGVRGATWL
jgi:hypothetical protein